MTAKGPAGTPPPKKKKSKFSSFMSKAWNVIKSPLSIISKIAKPVINKLPGGSIINAGLDFIL